MSNLADNKLKERESLAYNIIDAIRDNDLNVVALSGPFGSGKSFFIKNDVRNYYAG